jgi:hypothetical protein
MFPLKALASLLAGILLVSLSLSLSLSLSPVLAQPLRPAADAHPLAADVVKTVGTGGDYTTLKAAFGAINAGTLTGAIELNIISDTTETASAALNASGSGSASYTSVLIRPSGGAWTISGALVSTPLLDLNGADNVTIDGLNTGGNALTIANTTTSGASNSLRFGADATHNTITNASILGSSYGTILFNTAAAGGTGNDDNTISNCNIGPAGANLPAVAIYARGSTTDTSAYNSGNLITGNNIYDYFTATSFSDGILLDGGNRAWTISNNRFYQTGVRTQTAARSHAAIEVGSSQGNDGHTISGNIIGYASAAGTGTYTIVSAAASGTTVRGIYYSAASTATATTIQDNTITAISVSGGASGTDSSAAFAAILVYGSGEFNLTDNTIGSLATAGAISIAVTSTDDSDVYGIYVGVNANKTLSNNQVGGITASNSSGGAIGACGMATTGNAATSTITNNTVGAAAAPISVSTTSTSGWVIGIYSRMDTSLVISNTIGYLNLDSGNTGVDGSASVMGLYIYTPIAAADNNISQNTIHALRNSHPTAAVSVTGLFYSGVTTGSHRVQRNFIHSLTVDSNSPTATVNGIHILAGRATYQNNMIALGSDMTANSPRIYGIYEYSASNIYYNSVAIGGSGVTAGSANSFAFRGFPSTTPRDYRNNIFYNARSNSGATGKHYAITVNSSTTGMTSNYNLLAATGTGGYTGFFNSVDRATLANWQTATVQDANSVAGDPQFLAASDLHINPAVNSPAAKAGTLIAAIPYDFDDEPRSATAPTIGADEVACTLITSGDWSNAANWSCGRAPLSSDDVVIPAGVTVTLTGDIELGSNLRVQGTLVPNGKAVTLTGSTAQTLIGNPLTFYKLVINKTNKTDTATIVGHLKVTSRTMITKGKLITASDYLDIDIDLDGTLALTTDITVGGSLIVTGTLQTNGHTITFDGVTQQTIGGSAATTFAGLTISNTLGVSLTGSTAITGTLDLYTGTLTVAGPALDLSGTSTGGGDLVGPARRSGLTPGTTYAFGNGSVALTFGVGGTIPGAVTVTLQMTAPAGITNSIFRTYDITQTGGSGFTTTLRLHYQDSDLQPGMDENNLKLYRHDAGGSWVEVLVTDWDIVENWLEAENVAQFSEWTAGNGTPTAVKMRMFRARSES